MEFVIDLVHNQVFLSAAGSWFVAQVTKIVIDIVKNGFSWKRLAGGGGMPSSHSATVTGLATSAALVYGGGSFEFVIALFFAFIVMYDAAGVRMATGEEARILNLIKKRDVEDGKAPLYETDLDEKMGHTIPEIIAGIIIGIGMAILIWNLL